MICWRRYTALRKILNFSKIYFSYMYMYNVEEDITLQGNMID